MVMFCLTPLTSDASFSTGRWFLDIAVGAAGLEQIILENLIVQVNASGDRFIQPYIGPLPLSLPAGTRVAARCASTLIAAGRREFGVIMYGFS
jgi:hypothetical protein